MIPSQRIMGDTCKVLIFLCGFLITFNAISQTPANDNCADAVAITVGKTCISNNFSNVNATTEPLGIAPDPSCRNYQGGDVWCKVVMPPSGALRIELKTLNSASPPSVNVYSGACGSLTEVICYQVDKDKTINEPDLQGETLFIRVFSFNSPIGHPFSLCVFEPVTPANDNCENAIPLPSMITCKTQNFTNAFASSESISNPGCRNYAGGDVWFTAIMPSSGVLRIEVDNLSTATPPSVSVYSGTCGNFTELICYDLDNGKTIYGPGLEGEKLYLRIFSFNSEEGNPFSLCVYQPSIPLNDNCNDAIPLTVSKSCSPENYTNALASEEPLTIAPVPDCRNYQGGDVWFKAVMPASGALRIESKNITITNSPSVNVYTGTCGNFTELICYQLDGTKTMLEQNLAGETLYIRVFSFNSDEGNPFSLCVYEPVIPSNDNCSNATPLTVGASCIKTNYTNVSATKELSSIASDPGCSYYSGGDVWFTVTVPSSGSLSVELEGLVSANPLSMTVYSGSCGAFKEIACFNLNSNPVVSHPSLAGQKLYLRVYSYNSEEGNPFSICVYDSECIPITNKINQTSCEGASVRFGSLTLTAEGLYSQTFKTPGGCDSLVNLNLRFNKAYQIKDTVTVCNGDEYTFPDGTKKENVVSPFQYISKLQTKHGCDSLITTYVDIVRIDTRVVSDGLTLSVATPGDTYQWVACKDGYPEITGETVHQFKPYSSGEYAVKISQNKCTEVSACYAVLITDIKEEEDEYLIDVFPNPTSGTFNVSFNSGFYNVIITVTDMMGRQVYENNCASEDIRTIELKNISPGTYCVSFNINGKRLLTKRLTFL